MRTQSTETKLRHEKRENRILLETISLLRQELNARRQWGGMMSNLCFNLAQNDKYDPTHRQSMKDCREGWDKIRTVK